MLLATTDTQGSVKIWRLSTALSEVRPRELETLRRMASRGLGVEPSAAEAEQEETEGYEEGFEEDD